MCLKSTLSDLETQTPRALNNDAKATGRLKFTGIFCGFPSEFICSSLGITLLQGFST